MSENNESQWLSRIDRLAAEHYLVVDNAITDQQINSLLSYLQMEMENEELAIAGIGLDADIEKSVRGDYIKWVEEQTHESLSPFFNQVNHWIDQLNRWCFLGISGYEFHLAYYPEGTFYKRHLDQFQERNNRLISCVFYLNPEWKEGDGGELKLFLEGKEEIVHPVGGRMIIFKSDVLPHEVLMTNKPRYSLTGWFLKQPPGLGFLA